MTGIYPGLLLLLAASGPIPFDRKVRIPAADSQGLELTVRNRPGAVSLRYHMIQGEAGIRAVVIAKADQPRFRNGRPVKELASTPYARSGQLKVHLTTPGDYVIILDNRAEARASAHVQVSGHVTYDREPVTAWELPPLRRYAVVALSLALFLGVGWWSGSRVVEGINGQRRNEPPPPYI